MTNGIKKQEGGKTVWTITDLDYEAELFPNAEARIGAGVGPTLWAKWLHRNYFAPDRAVKGGRGGQYAARKIFQIRVMHLLVEEARMPPSEAQQIAELAAKGPWNPKDLAAAPNNNWKRYVLRESPPPVDLRLIFSKTENCWGYKILGKDDLKNSASVVLAATRELISVSKYCWNILHEGGASKVRGE